MSFALYQHNSVGFIAYGTLYSFF